MADTPFSRFVFNYKSQIHRSLKALSLVFSLFAMLFIAYYYGFPQTEARNELFINVLQWIFSFYVISFALRWLFVLDRWPFIKRNWLEAILMVLLAYDVISLYLFEMPVLNNLFQSLGFENFADFYLLFMQGYLLLFVGIDAVKFSYYFSRIRIKTPAVFGLSFILLILVGTGLLMMPEMTTIPGSMPFLDALFTSTSASCVTGLIVVDTATYFTVKGQFVILMLFQIGGIGIITFALFFAFFLRSGGGLQSQNTLKEMLNTANLVSSRNLLKQVVFLTILIEAIGAFLIYTLIGDLYSGGDRFFYAVFHSISAFCNAGFSLYTDGLFEEVVRTKYVFHLVVAALIFFGSIGFPAIQDLFSPRSLRERMDKPWKDWELSTKIALFSSISLILFGTISIFLMERGNSLKDMDAFGQVVGALFQSITTRTAGFNTIDIGGLGAPTLLIMIFLMFIGASSASTGGGIKTSTFVVIFLSVFATIRNRKRIELGKRAISIALLNRALTIFIFAASFIFVSVFALSISDPQFAVIDLVFEAVSAFCTVGLSTGITGDLSSAGQIILMLSMYLGRVGILTLVVALSSAQRKVSYSYPEAHLMIG